MNKEEAQKLLKFKREVEIIMAKGIREIMGLKEHDVITNNNIFFGMSEKIMTLAEKTLI